MNRNILKKFAPEARRDFIQAITDRASYYGITKDVTEPVAIEGDVAVITGRAFPKKVGEQRKRLEERVNRQGFDQVMEAMAYTWFNRLVAIRFMELHGYLEHGYRVLSHSAGNTTPEILEHADSVDLPGLDSQQVIDLKLAGDKDAELYRMLLIAQCNALHKAMPFLFERIDDETELLLPDNLLHSDSLIRTLVETIPEEDWQEVEIIGWLYQFYISEKKDEVIGKVVKSEDIPAATQLFTPNWIVKYLVQNSLGRQWMATYPNSPLKGEMEYYIEPAEQILEAQEQLKAITPDSLNPEELTLLDPACGSGHILVEAYDLLKAIYEERGYRARDIPRLILEKNLYGLEIDDRAAQLAAFALMMKARADDRRIFAQGVQPQVVSIQGSKGLDAKEITEALNVPILKTELPPSGELFEEIAEEKSPLFSKKNLSVEGDISQADVARLIDLFENGKTFGSLIRVPKTLTENLPAISERLNDVTSHGGMFEQSAARSLRPLVQQARIMVRRYDAVVANPPYLGSKHMNREMKRFAEEHFPEGKSDLFAVFLLRLLEWVIPNKHLGVMTPFTWMFIKSYESLRHTLVMDNVITSLIQPEYHAFFDSAFVPICTFLVQRSSVPVRGTFIDLSDFYGEDLQPIKTREAINSDECAWKYEVDCHEFSKIPGSPVAYWASDSVRDVCANSPTIEHFANPMQGSTLGENERFLRYWYEVSRRKTPTKWVPCIKGGKFRKWYGNNLFVVNWENNGQEVKATGRATIRNEDSFFRAGLEWNRIGSSVPAFRAFGKGFVYESASGIAFPESGDGNAVLGFLNSSVSIYLLRCLNPTLNVQSGDIARLPFTRADSSAVVKQLIRISADDWNECEISCDFRRLPLLLQDDRTLIGSEYNAWSAECTTRRERAATLESENNYIFIHAYGLESELSAEVPADRITLHTADREEDIQRLISYAIGCMMGRYSLDEPGLIYAHSGGEDFDPSRYQKCAADHDGIIPITEFQWFEDDAANRVEKFIATAWPKEHLEENLTFVAESIGLKKNESAREAIRRYLTNGFYKHHLPLYKKRPIYWLFSSGKQRAFQCLVYLHRYNAGTLARMRTEYVIPLSGKIDSRIEQLAGDITAASSTAHQKKLTKERDTLIKHSEELQKFDEKLKHYADQRIELDLDDGVKVNYGKFGDLLAEVKAITGKKPE